MIKLDCYNFINRYAFAPSSPELLNSKMAWVATVILGIGTAGLFHLGVACANFYRFGHLIKPLAKAELEDLSKVIQTGNASLQSVSQYFYLLAQPNKQWTKDGLTFHEMKDLFKNNRHIISTQIDNGKIAPQLKAVMLQFSQRVSEEYNTDAGHNLSAQITASAQSIYNEGQKPNWDDLPSELFKKHIFPHILFKRGDKEFECNIFSKAMSNISFSSSQNNLINLSQVSKSWNKMVINSKESMKRSLEKSLSEQSLSGAFDYITRKKIAATKKNNNPITNVTV